MRLLVAELMQKRGMTPYALARDSENRISQSAAYRLVMDQKESLRLEEIDALCDVLKVEPGELFQRNKRKPPARKS